MSSLPPTLNFPKMEEELCQGWKDKKTFKMQNNLSLERGDKVRANCFCVFHCQHSVGVFSFVSSPFSTRNTLSTMDLPLLPACLIMVIFWLVPSRILLLDTLA